MDTRHSRPSLVIPAKAGIHMGLATGGAPGVERKAINVTRQPCRAGGESHLGPRLRGGDEWGAGVTGFFWLIRPWLRWIERLENPFRRRLSLRHDRVCPLRT